MTQFYAYIYRDPDTMVPFYVGKGHDTRSHDHLKGTKNKHFGNKLKKLFEQEKQPLIEVIDAIDEDHSIFLECCLIQVIGRSDLGKGPLTNKTDGGEGLKNASLETRQKMAESKRGKKRPYMKQTAEHVEKRAAALRGKPRKKTEAMLAWIETRRGTKLSPEAIAKRTATRAANRLARQLNKQY